MHQAFTKIKSEVGEQIKHDADYYITQLDLSPHPEGGHYKSSFSSTQQIDVSGNERKLFTSIYFLLKSGEISHFHRLKSDEVWYYHAGSPLIVHVIDDNGYYYELKLGLDFENGEVPQAVVPKNSIFGSSIVEDETFSLVGCMVSPGFDFKISSYFRKMK